MALTVGEIVALLGTIVIITTLIRMDVVVRLFGGGSRERVEDEP